MACKTCEHYLKMQVNFIDNFSLYSTYLKVYNFLSLDRSSKGNYVLFAEREWEILPEKLLSSNSRKHNRVVVGINVRIIMRTINYCFIFSIPETTKTPGREAGWSKGGPHKRVGDQQTKGARTTEPVAARTEWPLQSAVRTAKESYCCSGDQELNCKCL